MSDEFFPSRVLTFLFFEEWIPPNWPSTGVVQSSSINVGDLTNFSGFSDFPERKKIFECKF